MVSEKKTRVLYVDLDGTIRISADSSGFVNRAEDVRVIPRAKTLLKAYKSNGWRIISISNQGGIALGHLSMKDCCEAMTETYRQCGGVFDKMAWCQHHPDAKDPEYALCWCRKPGIGMLVESALALAHQHHEYYPVHLSLFVGDRPEDEMCAKAANIPFLWAEEWRKKTPADVEKESVL